MSSPFSITFNAKNPIKPKDVPKQVTGAQSTGATKPMTDSEEKLMKQTQSMTDKAIKNQDYPGQHGVIIGKGAPEMSPLDQGGYVGGGDVAGAHYVPTGQMYANMFAKIGQAVADIDPTVKKNKNKKDTTNFDKKIKESDKKISDELAKTKKEIEELENTELFWDGTKFIRRPKPGLNTVIPTTTKIGK